MEWTTERPNAGGWYFYQVVDANGEEGPIRVGYVCTTVPFMFTAITWEHNKKCLDGKKKYTQIYTFVANMEDYAKEANAVLRWAGPIAEPTSITENGTITKDYEVTA